MNTRWQTKGLTRQRYATGKTSGTLGSICQMISKNKRKKIITSESEVIRSRKRSLKTHTKIT